MTGSSPVKVSFLVVGAGVVVVLAAVVARSFAVGRGGLARRPRVRCLAH
jgi:hypothetical protein